MSAVPSFPGGRGRLERRVTRGDALGEDRVHRWPVVRDEVSDGYRGRATMPSLSSHCVAWLHHRGGHEPA
jgi:hypothetical protein